MSTQAKHTPGPWFISNNGYAILAHDGGTLIVEHPAIKWESLDAASAGAGKVLAKMLPEARANAHLIAAAPDLLRALQDVLSALQPICDHADARAVPDRDMRAFDRACGSARAIIEKATRS